MAPAPASLPPRVATSQEDMRLCLSCRRPAQVTTSCRSTQELDVRTTNQNSQRTFPLHLESVVECRLLAGQLCWACWPGQMTCQAAAKQPKRCLQLSIGLQRLTGCCLLLVTEPLAGSLADRPGAGARAAAQVWAGPPHQLKPPGAAAVFVAGLKAAVSLMAASAPHAQAQPVPLTSCIPRGCGICLSHSCGCCSVHPTTPAACVASRVPWLVRRGAAVGLLAAVAHCGHH